MAPRGPFFLRDEPPTTVSRRPMNDQISESIESSQGAPSLDNVVVVLSRTTEPMNIGATCRAMKTMGLKHLRLMR